MHIKKTYFLLLLLFINPAFVKADVDSFTLSSLATQGQNVYQEIEKDSSVFRVMNIFCKLDQNNTELKKVHLKNEYNIQKLNEITQKTIAIQKDIEKHEKRDWEEKFGQSGIYRESVSTSRLCSYYLTTSKANSALLRGSNISEKETIQIISELGELFNQTHQPACLLYSAQLYESISQINQARQVLDIAKQYTKTDEINFKIKLISLSLEPIEKLKIETIEKLYAETKTFERIGIYDKLLMSKISLSKGQGKLLTEILAEEPSLTRAVAEGMLADYKHGHTNIKNNIETDLIAYAVMQNSTAQNLSVIYNLTKLKESNSSYLFYAAGYSLVKDKPTLSIELLIKSINLKENQYPFITKPDKSEISKVAAELAWNIYYKDESQIKLALEAFNQWKINSNISPEDSLLFNYALLLEDNNQNDEAITEYKKIADSINNPYRIESRYKIVMNRVINEDYLDKVTVKNIVAELKEISTLTDSIDFKFKILNSIAMVLVENANSQTDILQAIEILEGNPKKDEELYFRALIKTGKIEKAIMLADVKNIRNTTVEILLNRCAENYEQYKKLNIFNPSIREKLIELAMTDMTEEKSSLVKLKIEILALFSIETDLSEIIAQKIVDTSASDIQTLRTQARIFHFKKQYKLSATRWNQITVIYKSQMPETFEASNAYWQSRYNMLLNYSLISEKCHNEAIRASEILINSTKQSSFWREMLDSIGK